MAPLGEIFQRYLISYPNVDELKVTLNKKNQLLYVFVVSAMTLFITLRFGENFLETASALLSDFTSVTLFGVMFLAAWLSMLFLFLREMFLLIFGLEVVFDRKNNTVFKRKKHLCELNEVEDIRVDTNNTGEGVTYDIVISFQDKKTVILKRISKKKLAMMIQNTISEFRQKN